MYDQITLDTSQRLSDSPLSQPVWNIRTREILKGDKIRVSLAIPPIPSVNSRNYTLTIDSTPYSITAGIYDNSAAIVTAFNTAIALSGVSLTLSNTTGKVTATGSVNFTLATTSAGACLGFTTAKSGATSYVADVAMFFGRNVVVVTSNLKTLIAKMSTAAQPETFEPQSALISVLYPVVSSYHYIRSEWLESPCAFTLTDISFGFVDPRTPTYYETVLSPWSATIEFLRA